MNLCNPLSISLVQMTILPAYICNTNATWVCSYENVALCRNSYAMIYTIFRAKNRNGELTFQVQTALKTKQNKTKKPCLYKELPLINDTFDKVQIPDEEIACL